MSKKSKKILAYLMFVAALCGTPAVSEARGGSGGQVATEKASVARRENSDQGFSYYILKNYGPEILKWLFLGGAGYGTAKVSHLKVLARHALGVKNADERKLEEFKKKLDEEKQKFGIEVKNFIKEKSLFEQKQANAINNNEKLFEGNAALGMKVDNLLKQAKKDKETIEELKNRNQSLNNELVGEKDYNAQLLNVTEEDKRKLDLLSPYLSNLIDSKMSGEFVGSYDKEEGYWKSHGVNELILEPFSIENVVRVALVEYNANCDVVGKAEKIELGTDGFLNNVKVRAEEKLGQKATVEDISLVDFGLRDFGVLGLARYSFAVKKDGKVEKVVAAYFPLKSVQEIKINVENNNNENNENDNINENENIENNENVNNEGN